MPWNHVQCALLPRVDLSSSVAGQLRRHLPLHKPEGTVTPVMYRMQRSLSTVKATGFVETR